MEEPKANLGLATTRELLAELSARIEVSGQLDYKTVDDETQGEDPAEERKLPEGKRVVRTKSSADRVYLIDEEKKTRQWITSPEILESLGFEMGDVGDVDDTELLKYQMASPVYRVES